MRKLLILGASALLFASLVVDDASAQRSGGFRGGGFGGGFRGAAIGGGFRGGVIGGGFRSGVVGGGFRGAAIGGGFRGWGGPGFVGRRVGWGGWRGGWGWPVAAGIGFAAGYYGSCYRWNGWDWVNVCYQPYYYGYPDYW